MTKSKAFHVFLHTACLHDIAVLNLPSVLRHYWLSDSTFWVHVKNPLEWRLM